MVARETKVWEDANTAGEGPLEPLEWKDRKRWQGARGKGQGEGR